MSVQSVVRSFEIIKAIAPYPQGVGVTELARQTGLHKSTVSRMLTTLEEVGAITRVNGSPRFIIDPAFLKIFAAAPFPENLIALARPFLVELNQAVGEDVGLAIPDEDQVRYIDQVSSDPPVQVRDWTGERFPLHTTSTGKLILAYQDQAFLEHYLSRPLEAYTERTLTRSAELHAQCTRIRAQGFDWSFGEFARELNATSAPIFDSAGNLVGAINIYGPSFRFPPPGQQEQITRRLQDTAQRLSERLKTSQITRIE